LPSTTLGFLKLGSPTAVIGRHELSVTVCLSLVCAEINFPKLFAKIVATEEKQLVVYIIPLSV